MFGDVLKLVVGAKGDDESESAWPVMLLIV
jgi:hypothetical protein